METDNIWDWLEPYRIPDQDKALAYEDCAPQNKAALKTAIAMAYFNFGSISSSRCNIEVNQNLGYWQKIKSRPNGATLLLFPANYSAPARMCAAALPPLLRGVRDILAISVGGAPQANICTTFELCGIEDVFALDIDTLQSKLDRLHIDYRLNIILLHGGELKLLAQMARERYWPYYEEWHSPRIIVLDPEKFSLDLIKFAHGFLPHSASFSTCANIPFNTVDAVFTSSESQIDAPLILTPGCECFWLFPDYGPDFFSVSQKLFGVIQNLPPDIKGLVNGMS